MRVQFTSDIISPACGDHPDLLIVSKGATGELVDKPGGSWPAYVDIGNGRVIGCKWTEFLVIGESESGTPDA